jgi:hypothetical protein
VTWPCFKHVSPHLPKKQAPPCPNCSHLVGNTT